MGTGRRPGLRIGGHTPPLALQRWTLQEIAQALQIQESKASQLLESLCAEEAKVPNPTGYITRRHFDGTFSRSFPGTYEALQYPNAHTLEGWLHHKQFAQVDAALAEFKIKIPKKLVGSPGELRADGRLAGPQPPPELVWADGTPMSVRAMGWFYKNLSATTHYQQVERRDRTRPVAGAVGFFRDAFTPESMVLLAQWALQRGIKATTLPLSDVVIDEIGKRLAERHYVPHWATDLIQRARRGRQVLMRAGKLGASKSIHLCHPSWPVPEDDVGSLEDWRPVMERFLDEATRRGEGFAWSTLRDHYLAHPWFGPLVKARQWSCDGEPVELEDSSARLDAQLLRLIDSRTSKASVPPFLSPPMSVAEYRRRARAAGLTAFKEARGPYNDPSHFLTLPGGTLNVVSTKYGYGYGGMDVPVWFVEFLFESENSNSVLWSYKSTSQKGWDKLDPTTQRFIADTLGILMAPVRAEFPDALGRGARVKVSSGKWAGREVYVRYFECEGGHTVKPDGAHKVWCYAGGGQTFSLRAGEVEVLKAVSSGFAVGQRVVIGSGKHKGATGKIFWYGDSKYGNEKRLGVTLDSGDGKAWLSASQAQLHDDV